MVLDPQIKTGSVVSVANETLQNTLLVLVATTAALNIYFQLLLKIIFNYILIKELRVTVYTRTTMNSALVRFMI